MRKKNKLIPIYGLFVSFLIAFFSALNLIDFGHFNDTSEGGGGTKGIVTILKIFFLLAGNSIGWTILFLISSILVFLLCIKIILDEDTQTDITQKTEEEILETHPIKAKINNWYFRKEKISKNLWNVECIDLYGRKISKNGLNPEELISELENDVEDLYGNNST